MGSFHVSAALPNGARKSVFNLDRGQIVDLVIEFVRDGTITTKWGKDTKTRQCYELKIFETPEPYNKKTSGSFEDFVAGKRNRFSTFEKEVKKRLAAKRYRVFVVMPIQGDEYGDQLKRNVFLEFTARFSRFSAIEAVLDKFECVAIRIDREAPMGSLVERIKEEIQRADFVVADLTDGRPSCYFEVGYAEALDMPVLFVASRESVMSPGEDTRVHFDIHQNVQFFGNHDELGKKIRDVIEKNTSRLFGSKDGSTQALAS